MSKLAVTNMKVNTQQILIHIYHITKENEMYDRLKRENQQVLVSPSVSANINFTLENWKKKFKRTKVIRNKTLQKIKSILFCYSTIEKKRSFTIKDI